MKRLARRRRHLRGAPAFTSVVSFTYVQRRKKSTKQWFGCGHDGEVSQRTGPVSYRYAVLDCLF